MLINTFQSCLIHSRLEQRCTTIRDALSYTQ